MSATGQSMTGTEPGRTEQPEILEDTKEKRAKLAKAAKRLKDIAAEREHLTADKRAILEELTADGISKKAIERAVKDCDLEPEKLERQDFWYEMTRRALGKPVQLDAFSTDDAPAKH